MEHAEMDSLSACLLQWVKSFDGVRNVEGLGDLGDGVALWAILKEVDPDFFAGALPEPEVTPSSEWTRKWQNLKHVEKQVSLYYRDVCNGQEHIGVESVPDLKAIAAESSVRELEKLIMAMIRTAMASPESNRRMAQRLMSMGRENAMVIATELRNMEEAEYTASEPESRDESEQGMAAEPMANGSTTAPGLYQDPLLEREEELLQAHATIEKLQASQDSALRQIQELRQDKDRLQEAFDTYRSEIESKGRKTGGDDAFKKLQRQADNDKAYIDDLESQIESSRDTLDQYEKQLQQYKNESEAGQKLRDDVQMFKSDNEDLRLKIKANENLKKKIQTLQEQEKANATFREELKQANERLEDLERLRHVQAGLEKEIIEKKGLIRNQEYQINELTTTRKHAEYEARALAQKLQEARERHDRDHEAIEELRTRLQDANIEEPQEDEPTQESGTSGPNVPEQKVPTAKVNESSHFAEKIALLEQQLSAADMRLKQAAERNDALEEEKRSSEASSVERQKSEQQAQEYEKTIAELRRELQTATASLKQKAEVPATQDMASLQRENHLMATAWYDMSSRLQNNGVSLGRRRQDPKSWIGKQRALVGPGGGVQR